jgi:tetratricopeptide (TPR) repeat protein
MDTLKERLWLWQTTLKMAADHPVFGVGRGRWRIEFPAYAGKQTFRFYDAEQREIIFQRPHNDYLWVLAENGVIGLSLYLAIFATLLFYGFKTMRHAEDSNLKVMAGCMSFGLVGYMVIAFFSFPKERIVHSVLFMLIAACIITGYHKAFPTARKLPRNLVVSLGFIALPMLAFCIFVGGIRLNSEIHTRRALDARQKGDWHTVIAEIDQAESPFYQLDPTAMPVMWYRGVAHFSRGELESALSDFQAAYQAHPNQIHVLNNLASTYAGIGDYDKAMSYYRQALVLCPDFTVSRDNLALLSLYLEKKKAP